MFFCGEEIAVRGDSYVRTQLGDGLFPNLLYLSWAGQVERMRTDRRMGGLQSKPQQLFG